MNTQRKIQKIAHSIYLKNKKYGIENGPLSDWREAEAICRNRLKYWWWGPWHFISTYHYELVAIAAIGSLIGSIGMMLVNRNSVELNTRPYVSATELSLDNGCVSWPW